jgi:hypothetical protein
VTPGNLPKVVPPADAADATRKTLNMHDGHSGKWGWQAVGYNGGSGNGDQAIGPPWDPNKNTYYYGEEEMNAIEYAHGYGEGVPRPGEDFDMDAAEDIIGLSTPMQVGKPPAVVDTIEGGPDESAESTTHGTIIYTPYKITTIPSNDIHTPDTQRVIHQTP